jgi:hypothetical protein
MPGGRRAGPIAEDQMTTPPAPAVMNGDLRQVRTAADATAWLDRRAAKFLTEAEAESSPDHARGLRLAGTTLQAVALLRRSAALGLAVRQCWRRKHSGRSRSPPGSATHTHGAQPSDA